MKKFITSVVVTAAFIAFPAFAGNVAVVVHTDAVDIGQIAGAGAVAPIKATADAVNIAGLSQVTGSKVNTAVVHTDVSNVAQGAIAVAAASGCGTCGQGGVAVANATNIAGLSNVDVQTQGQSYVHVGTSATRVLQGSAALALANKNATAAATNLAGVTTVSVNVD